MRRRLIPGLVLAIVIGLVIRSVTRRSTGESVETAVVATASVEATVLASGRLEPHVEVEIRPEIAGTVAAIAVQVGDVVAAGDPLMTIEARSYQADYEEQRARLRIAESTQALRASELAHQVAMAARYRKLFDAGVESRERLDDIELERRLAAVRLRQARQSVDEAAATLDRAKVSLAKSEVRAPRAGVVLDLGVEVGEVVIPGTIAGAGSSLVTIADTSAVIAKVQVEEADIMKVRTGQLAKVYPIAHETEAVLGEVVFVAPRAQRFEDRKTRSFDVRIALRPSQLDVRPGMSCRADIVVEGRPRAVVVPSQAVLRDDGATPPADYVFVVDRGRARRVPVKVGIASDTVLEIVAGVVPGDRVIAGPQATLRRVRTRQSLEVSSR